MNYDEYKYKYQLFKQCRNDFDDYEYAKSISLKTWKEYTELLKGELTEPEREIIMKTLDIIEEEWSYTRTENYFNENPRLLEYAKKNGMW